MQQRDEPIEWPRRSTAFAGPSRRTTRSALAASGSSRKPYNRPALEDADTSIAASPGQSPAASKSRRRSSGAMSDEPTLASPSISPVAQSRGGLTRSQSGLFGALGRAIAKPLSWLSSTPAAASAYSAPSNGKGLLPSSASSASIADLAAMRAAQSKGTKSSNDTRNPSASASEFGSMAGGLNRLRGRTSRELATDVESQDSSFQAPLPMAAGNRMPSGGMSASASMNALSGFRTGIASYSSYDTPSTSRRALNLGNHAEPPFTARSPSPGLSSAAAAVRAHGQRSRLSMGPDARNSLYSPAGLRRSGSLAPSDSASMTDVAAHTNASPGYAYGFGSEKRIGGLSGAALASRFAQGTAQHMTSRSPFAVGGLQRAESLASRSPFAPAYTRSEIGTATPGRSRAGSTLPVSPARSRPGSIYGGGGASQLSSTAGFGSKQRSWSVLNLAPPPSRPSEGEEIMREHTAAVRRAATPVRGGSMIGSRAGTPLSVKLGKRDAADALGLDMLDLDGRDSDAGSVTGSARKKQMVWDPEMGFISTEELKAREPVKPEPKNEAERILSILEGMRTPLGDARKDFGLISRTSTPSRLTDTISVPLPSPSRARSVIGAGDDDETTSQKSGPFSRRSTRGAGPSRLAASTSASTGATEDGMRAKLRRSTRTQPTSSPTRQSPVRRSRRTAAEHEQESDGETHEEAASDHHMSDEEREQRRAPSPPRRVTRGMAKAKAREGTASPPPSSISNRSPPKSHRKTSAKSPAKQQTQQRQRSQSPSKVAPSTKRVTRSQVASPPPAAQQEEEMDDEREDAELEAELAPAKKASRFQVLSSDASDATSRQRSSLRQGAEKKSRTHGKSGKISAWDSDEDDENNDLPDMETLEKIKLPDNFFPEGFTFGASAPSGAKSAAVSSKPISASKGLPDINGASSPQTSAGGGPSESGSLLDRLGGFAPPSTTPAKAPPAASGFSFAQPSQASDASANTKPPKTSLPSSDFFTKPSASASSGPSASEKNSGPPPNFFQSAVQPAETGTLGKPATASSATPVFSFIKPPATGPSTGGFSFSKPAETEASSTSEEGKKSSSVPDFFGAKKEGATNPSKAAPFTGFGLQPASSASTGGRSKPSASPAAPASAGFGALTKEEQSTPAASSPSFSFVAPAVAGASPSSAPFTGFKGFGAATPASSSSEADGSVPAGKKGKRGADAEEQESITAEPAAKKAGKGSAPAAPTGGFTFGGGSATSTPSGGQSSTTPNAPPAFGNSPFRSAASSSAPVAGGFTFSKPAPANDEAGKSAVPTFSFGTAAQPAVSSTPTSEAPKFAFGQSTPAANGTGGSSSTNTNGGGLFGGSSSNTSSNAGLFGGSFGSKPSGTTATSGTDGAVKPAGGFAFSGSSGFGAGAASSSMTTPATPVKDADAMDETSPSGQFVFGNVNTPSSAAQQPPSTQIFGGFGAASSKPAALASTGFSFGTGLSNPSSTPSFSFGQSSSTPLPTPGGTSGPFGQPSGPSTPSISQPQGSASGGFFGGGNTGFAPSTPTGTPGINFNFTGSNPSSTPATPSNSFQAQPNFNFGAPNAGVAGAATTPGGSSSSQPALFTFGSSTTPQSQPQPQPPSSNNPFQFGAPSATAGAAGGTAAAAAAGGQPLFNIGTASPSGPAGAGAGGPGGRQVKGLPRARRGR